MPRIGFPFFLLCYMEYFIFLVVDEVVLAAHIPDLILLGIGFHLLLGIVDEVVLTAYILELTFGEND